LKHISSSFRFATLANPEKLPLIRPPISGTFSPGEKVGSRFAPHRSALSEAKGLTVNSATRMRGLDLNFRN
ncbi:MAG: hypothetical protein ACRD2B_16675, partial [Terriglobia bacterium]